MNEFSAMGAWSHGVRFLAARPGHQALLLVGLGLVLPLAIQLGVQYALTGTFLNGTPPPDASPGYALLPAIGLVFQAAAFFASWRLGLGQAETLGGALRFGLLASLIATVAAILLLAFAGFAASQAGSPAVALFVFLFTAAPMILLLAFFGTVASALIGTGMAALLVIAMAASAITGNMGLAATMVGGSGFLVVLLLVLSVLLIWLAARFSCATAIMADGRRYNPIAAARASWALTWDAQWLIMRYLAVLGLILVVAIAAGLVALGGGAMLLQGSGAGVAQGLGVVFILGLALPMVALTVAVPAGIYRQLVGAGAPIEVFA